MEELILVVVYVNVGGLTPERSAQRMAIVQRRIKKEIEFLEIEAPGCKLVYHFLEVKNGKTRMECIYPVDEKMKERFEELLEGVTGFGWTNVKDGLPKTYSKYTSVGVAVWKEEYGEKSRPAYYSKREGGFHTDEGLKFTDITHWSYLLKPPIS